MMSGETRSQARPDGALPGLLLAAGLVACVPAMAQTSGGTGGATPAPADPTLLPQVNVTGDAETAFSPVQGFVARRSVTGTKTDTPVLETPQSLSVITRDQMDQQNAQTLNGAVRYTAGVTPETRGAVGTRYDLLKVRGFDADTYWNGLKLLGNGWYSVPQVDPFLMERIEVLRGPVSVLYGQAGAGGVINQQSKLPTLDPLHEVGIEFGNFRHKQLTFDLGGPLDADRHFLYRITGIGRAEDAQVAQTRNERIAIAPSFTWRPDNDTTLTLLGLYQYDPESAAYGSVPPSGSALPNPLGRISRRFYDGDPNFEKFNRTQGSLGYQFEHRFNDVWTVRSNGRWFHLGQEYNSVYGSGLQDDNRTLSRGTAASTDNLDTASFDNQLQGRFNTGPVQHTVLAGFDYQHLNTNYHSGFGTAPSIDIFSPTYNLAIEAPERYLVRAHSNQYGIYAQEQAKLGGFVLTLGGRQDWADSTTRNLTYDTTSKQSDHAFTGRVGLTYVFDNGIAPYVSYTESFVPQAGTDRTGKAFDPERGRQYEAGIKYQPPGMSALFTAAVFDLTRKNLLTTDAVNPYYQSQAGEARSQGVELEAKLSVTESLDVTASYTWLDTVYTRNADPTAGKHLPAVPSNQAAAWAYYTFHNGPVTGLSIGAGGRYTGETWSTDNSFKVKSFLLADATIRYDIGQAIPQMRGAEAYVNGQNLFDRRYVASCYYGEWCAFGFGRQVFAGLKYRW